MGLLLLILASAVLGSFLTLLAQFLLLYRRQPEPRADEAARAGDGFRYLKPVPGLPLREYLYGGGAEELAACSSEAGASSTPTPDSPAPPTLETCYFLNATILFLFRELRDTALARRWVTKKIKVEFEELLQTKTAGRLLEGLSLRDVFLGDTVPEATTGTRCPPPARRSWPLKRRWSTTAVSTWPSTWTWCLASPPTCS